MDKSLITELYYDSNIGNHINTILSYIESSEDLKLVKSCIMLLIKHNCKNPYVYFSLENLIISDKNEKIRLGAIEAISKLFPEKSVKPLLWVLNKEENFNILVSITQILSNFNISIVREAFIEKIKSTLSANDFKCRKKTSGYSEHLSSYGAQELSVLFFNTILLYKIKSKFKNLKYQLRRGYVRFLDYSIIDKPIINWRSRIEIENTNELKYFRYLNKLEVLRLFSINWVIKNELNLNYFIFQVKALEFIPQKTARSSVFGFLDSLEHYFLIEQVDIKNLKSNIWKLTVNKLIEIVINLSIILFLKSKFSNANIKLKDGIIVSLEIINKPLYKIPKSVEYLNGLRSLVLNSCKIYDLPHWINNLKCLKHLSLKNNNISTIPPSIGDLKSLKRIILNKNKIETLPSSLKSVKSLEVLDLSQNAVKNISIELEPNSLKCLDLSNNFIKVVPENLSKFSKLNYLNLSYNYIENLNWNSKLSSLQYLLLDSNKIGIIPNSLKQLTKLSILSLRNNRIKSIPLSLNKLKKLRCVDLRWNKVTKNPGLNNQINLLL